MPEPPPQPQPGPPQTAPPGEEFAPEGTFPAGIVAATLVVLMASGLCLTFFLLLYLGQDEEAFRPRGPGPAGAPVEERLGPGAN